MSLQNLMPCASIVALILGFLVCKVERYMALKDHNALERFQLMGLVDSVLSTIGALSRVTKSVTG